MTKRELNRLKKLIVDEFEFIREKNNSGIDLWGELHELVDDLDDERDRAIRKQRLSQDERDALSEFWWEQFEENIALSVRAR